MACPSACAALCFRARPGGLMRRQYKSNRPELCLIDLASSPARSRAVCVKYGHAMAFPRACGPVDAR